MAKLKILLGIIMVMSTQLKAQIILSTASKSNYQIVIATQAGKSDQQAAEVLKNYLFKITKASLPIVNDDQKPKAYEIVLGNTNRNKATEKFINDGFVIKTVGKRLFIYGNDQKSALNGVYHFLDQYLGCRKYSAAVEYIPALPTIEIKTINDLQNPQFMFRQVYYPDQYNDSFRNWHKLHLLEDEWGLWGHTFDKLVPAKTYFKAHPEYFALVNGVRKYTQLCLSNPEVYQIAVKNLKKEMISHPDQKYWSVSQNDGFGYCTCDKCAAIDQKYGGPQGSVINFVNKVAANFPDKTISTLAYLYSKHPVTGIKPAKNVSIMLSTIDLDRSVSIPDNPKANSFRNDLEGWSAISNSVMIWDYVVQFTNYMSPFPNQQTLAKNISWFAKNKVKGIFTQGSEAGKGEFTSLKTYLLAKLSWNPGLDVVAEKKQFMDAYYGKAAPDLEEYEKTMELELSKSKRLLDIYGDPSAEWNSWLKPSQIDRYSSILDHAESAVGNHTEILNRVKTERLPLEYAVLQQARFYGLEKHGVFESNGNSWKIRNGFEQKVNRFISSAKSLGIRQLSEDGQTIDNYALEWKKIFTDGPLLHLATGKSVRAITPFNTDYPGKGIRSLTDGTRGYQNFQYNYLGWLGDDMQVVIDLGTAQSINKVVAGFLEDQRHWVFLPSKITVETSGDEHSYVKSGELTINAPDENYDKQTARFSIDIKDRNQVRYIRITAKNLMKLPEWRDYPNNKPWIFADEIEVH